MSKSKKVRITVITGLSGSGKSTVIKALEDLDFYCIDNLPIPLIDTFCHLAIKSKEKIANIALGIDIRGLEFFNKLPNVIGKLKKKYKVEIIFLHAEEKILIQRFSATRRKHPLATKNLSKAIATERANLTLLEKEADIKIDTTNMNVHELKLMIFEYFHRTKEHSPISIQFSSFGFKYGIPPELDIIFDARFMPNPYFQKELRELTGKNKRVANYVLRDKDVKEFNKKVVDLLKFLIPLHQKEGRMYLNIGIGCTGGKHRSVVIAEYLANKFRSKYKRIKVIHSDIEKE